ncbi:Leucine-rich repeat-containing protein 52 BK channel auxiliary gamma subunit LRRC52 [Takifugu flavidus]|uniref:Leucine-rich repeat-containing protein 52 BK channel auxiliary gamma subunit LRRC52 n=1 Tax=Takifugu flavidus TaxID=433684 RepID=A0A5C6MTN3_9TELE|nr:Leucine-rich repeat-containing protein 52 BK channel auxiliary gamma subunit LRRC52 [Takifugu flavidus]
MNSVVGLWPHALSTFAHAEVRGWRGRERERKFWCAAQSGGRGVEASAHFAARSGENAVCLPDSETPQPPHRALRTSTVKDARQRGPSQLGYSGKTNALKSGICATRVICLEIPRAAISPRTAPQTHAGCPERAGESWSSSARVHDALGAFAMRLLPEPSAQSLRLLFLFIFVMGVTPSPALTAGCPDRCVCDDQLVVQCAGQELTLFPNDLPLATRQLIISNNRIGDLPALQLNYLSDLVYLDCSNNSLTEISESTFGNLRKLAYLDLSFNTLLQIEDRTFGPLASLVMLRLTDNPSLGEIHPDAFSENIALQVLDVSRNNLTALNISSLIALPALRSLGLSGNPWSCDCDTEDLCLWVQIEGYKFQDMLMNERLPSQEVSPFDSSDWESFWL